MPVVKSADELNRLVMKVLLAAGADERNARRVADHVVLTNLSGVDTHGINLIPPYIERIKAGEIVPTAWPEIISETPTTALIKGSWTFGHSTAKFAMDVAIEKAARQNIAIVGAVQLNHIGRLGEYSEMAAANGMVALITNGGFSEHVPMAVPYGGRQVVLHTNPWSMGFPTGSQDPMMFDYATTASSQVKVANARRRGEDIPPGWIVDKNGNPSTDPNAFFEGGGLLPFGEHKGYAMMMASEFITRVLTGSDTFVNPPYGGVAFGHAALVMIVFKADVFRPLTEYAASADELELRVRAVPPAPGFQQVLVPGDLEARTREIRRRDGIPIADDVWKSVTDLLDAMGLSES